MAAALPGMTLQPLYRTTLDSNHVERCLAGCTRYRAFLCDVWLLRFYFSIVRFVVSQFRRSMPRRLHVGQLRKRPRSQSLQDNIPLQDATIQEGCNVAMYACKPVNSQYFFGSGFSHINGDAFLVESCQQSRKSTVLT